MTNLKMDNFTHYLLLSIELSFLVGSAIYLFAEYTGTGSIPGLITSPLMFLSLVLMISPIVILFGISMVVIVNVILGKNYNKTKFFIYVIYSSLICGWMLKEEYIHTIWNRYLIAGAAIGIILWFIDVYQRKWLKD